MGGVNTTIQAGKISLRIKLFKIFTEKGIIINCYRKANSKNGAPVAKILKHFSILYWKIVNFEIMRLDISQEKETSIFVRFEMEQFKFSPIYNF